MVKVTIAPVIQLARNLNLLESANVDGIVSCEKERLPGLNCQLRQLVEV